MKLITNKQECFFILFGNGELGYCISRLVYLIILLDLVWISLIIKFEFTIQIEASTSTPPPPPGIPRVFDHFNLPGGGEFDPHA